MRRKDREITAPEEIEKAFCASKICRLGLCDEKGMYILPMSYGYENNNGQYVLYFHSAKEGRKIHAIEYNQNICFEIDADASVYARDELVPCTYSTSFISIIGNGRAEFIESHNEKADALNHIMQRQTGKSFTFSDAMTDMVCVFRVIVTDFSCKKHE